MNVFNNLVRIILENSYKSDNYCPAMRVVPAEINEPQSISEFHSLQQIRIRSDIEIQDL